MEPFGGAEGPPKELGCDLVEGLQGVVKLPSGELLPVSSKGQRLAENRQPFFTHDSVLGQRHLAAGTACVVLCQAYLVIVVEVHQAEGLTSLRITNLCQHIEVKASLGEARASGGDPLDHFLNLRVGQLELPTACVLEGVAQKRGCALAVQVGGNLLAPGCCNTSVLHDLCSDTVSELGVVPQGVELTTVLSAESAGLGVGHLLHGLGLEAAGEVP